MNLLQNSGTVGFRKQVLSIFHLIFSARYYEVTEISGLNFFLSTNEEFYSALVDELNESEESVSRNNFRGNSIPRVIRM